MPQSENTNNVFGVYSTYDVGPIRGPQVNETILGVVPAASSSNYKAK